MSEGICKVLKVRYIFVHGLRMDAGPWARHYILTRRKTYYFGKPPFEGSLELSGSLGSDKMS